jgi:copper(I)-binding protein
MNSGFAKLPISILLGVLLGCSGGDPAPKIRVDEVWARAMPLMTGTGMGSGTNSAVYGLIRNESRSADVLLGGATESALSVEIHESRLEEDMMRMRRVDSLEIPAGETVELRPGGLHIMLVGLSKPLVDGSVLQLTLRFRHAGGVRVDVPIRSRNEEGR